ncbi:MAG: glycine hydroxymethyltransferase [Alteromonas naphthalenivorans]|jgi:glycine hydroxymethyltransferase
MSLLKNIDPEISAAINQELTRSEQTLNLIASENYTWPAVMEATGSVMTNKYAEGYPSRRYYSGCEHVDMAENLARDRVKKLFGAEHANVQPHSGSQANMAVYFAVLNPGDTILGMNLAAGGHLTHGYPINFSGKFYNSVNYGVNKETEQLDYDEIERLAKEHKPKLIICGASAYSQFIDFERIAQIAKSIGAYSLGDIAHIAGPIAAGLHPSPFPHMDFVTSTTHKTLRGPRGGLILCKQEFASKVDKAIMPGIQGGPLMHHIAAKAVAFKLALEPDFKEYQKQILANAKTMADTFTELGYRVVTGSTINHLMVIDVRNKNITGKIAEETLEKIGIVVNRNCIPFDTESPFVTSGIRLGTPALTSRGLKESEIKLVTQLIDKALIDKDNEQELKKITLEVKNLCLQFPIYESINKNYIPTLQKEGMQQL